MLKMYTDEIYHQRMGVIKEADDTYTVEYKGYEFSVKRDEEADLAYLTHDSERPELNSYEERILLSLMNDADDGETY